jgi:peptidoglycan hydrolase CwlO-like protein
MTAIPCAEHSGIVEQLRAGREEFSEIKTNQREMSADIKSMNAKLDSVINDHDSRIKVLEKVNQSVNRAAWGIGIPILVAALLGIWGLVKTYVLKVK